MDPEMRELLKRNAKLAEENNTLLHKMRRSALWGNVFRVVYWIVILFVSFGAYYFLEPYAKKAVGVYQGAQADLDSFKKFRDSFHF